MATGLITHRDGVEGPSLFLGVLNNRGFSRAAKTLIGRCRMFAIYLHIRMQHESNARILPQQINLASFTGAMNVDTAYDVHLFLNKIDRNNIGIVACLHGQRKVLRLFKHLVKKCFIVAFAFRQTHMISSVSLKCFV